MIVAQNLESERFSEFRNFCCDKNDSKILPECFLELHYDLGKNGQEAKEVWLIALFAVNS